MDLPSSAGAIDVDERYMRAAIEEARLAEDRGDVPVGAVVVHEARVIGRAHNQREQLQDPTAHAEMLALTSAASFIESWRLIDCTLYVTLEPCIMCAGAMLQARIPRVVYGTTDPKAGGCGSVYDITSDERLNHRVEVVSGVLESECADLLRGFFKDRRATGRK